MMIRIEDIMTEHPHTGLVTTTLPEAIGLCKRHKIRHLPIVDDENVLLGLVSERTLLAAQESTQARLSDNQRQSLENKVRLEEIMVKNVHTVSPKASVEEAARHIEQHRIGCLPVVVQHKLVGIITDSDFVGVAITLLEMMSEQEPVTPD